MGTPPTVQSVLGQRVVIAVGDMAVSNNSNVVLSTFALGTCVGVVMYHAGMKIGGVLHLMLPSSTLSPEKAVAKPSMFADSGMALLMKELEGMNVEWGGVKVYVGGGASLMNTNDYFKIGDRNVETVKGILREKGIGITVEDVGGYNNRTLHLRMDNGELQIKTPGGTNTVSLA